MSKKVRASTLMFEITNVCNMQCEHCLRGDSGKDYMDKKIIDIVLQQVDDFSITFTGGEPSLYPEAIRYAVDNIITNDKTVTSFFVATNGKKYSQEMVNALIELNAYILETQGMLENYSSLALSRDEFHEDIDKMNEFRYRGLSFFSESKIQNFINYSSGNMRGIINEGNAHHNGIGTRDIEREEICVDKDDFSVDNILIDGILYINVHGDVIIGCDYSYENQQKYKIGNVLERPLFDILYDAAIKAGYSPKDTEEAA